LRPAAVQWQSGGQTKQRGGSAKPAMCFHKSTVFGMFDFDCHPQHASDTPNPARKIVPRQIEL
jgi:hypothetical protein